MTNKKYLNISEVSKLLQIEEHKIRYWDSVDPKQINTEFQAYQQKVKVVLDTLIEKILKEFKN